MLSAKALFCIFFKILKINLKTYAVTFMTLLHYENLLIGSQEYGILETRIMTLKVVEYDACDWAVGCPLFPKFKTEDRPTRRTLVFFFFF